MASSSLGVRLLPEKERGLAAVAIAGLGYVAAGTPLAHPAVIVHIYNATDAIVSFSIDGTNSFASLAPGASFTINAQANKGVAAALSFAQGTQFYISQTTATAPTTGFAFISAFYAATNLGV